MEFYSKWSEKKTAPYLGTYKYPQYGGYPNYSPYTSNRLRKSPGPQSGVSAPRLQGFWRVLGVSRPLNPHTPP